MAIRRSITLSNILRSDTTSHADIAAELLALLISVLMVVGIALIRPFIRKMTRAGAKLGESEERYRLVLEASHDPIIQFDTECTCVLSNTRAAALARSTPAEMVGKTIWDLEPGDSADAHVKVLRRVVDTGCGEKGETYIEQVGRHFLWNIQPIVDMHEKIAGTRIQMYDITQRKLVEEELQVRARQQAVIANLGQRALAGIELSVLMDEMVEQVAETLRLEYSNVLELLPDDSSLLLRAGVGWKEGWVGTAVVGAGSDSQAGYTLACETPVVVVDLRTETRFRGPSILVEHELVSGMSVIIQGLDRPFGVMGVHTAKLRKFTQDDIHFLQAAANLLREVGRRTVAEEEKQMIEAQLRQHQKLQAIGTLASGVAHEINNPIDGIMNYAQLIDDRLDPQSALREFAQEIGQETERVAKIVRQLLAFSRHDEESHSPARVADIANDTISLIHTIIRRDQISLDVDVPDDLPLIKCRSQQIQQVIINLLTNARDALNQRYPEHDPDKIMKLTVRPFEKVGKPWIRTTVEDHGAGIGDEVVDRVYDPFFTTKDRTRGTGLGLPISRSITHDHHGELYVESEAGEYSRFQLELPVDNGWSLDDDSRG